MLGVGGWLSRAVRFVTHPDDGTVVPSSGDRPLTSMVVVVVRVNGGSTSRDLKEGWVSDGGGPAPTDSANLPW